MDMSAAYRSAVSIHLPKAVIVFDHFHVVKLFNEKLSDLRRALYREATEVQHKEVLKGTRWLLLKNAENLDPEKDEKVRLKEALKLNEPLAAAYYMKEDLHGGSGSSRGSDSPRRSWTGGSAGRRRRGSRSCSRWPRRWRRTGAVCWRTTT